MTHFRCAVFHYSPDDYESLIEPYCEDDERYYSFTPMNSEDINWLKDRYQKDCNEGKLLREVSFEEWLNGRGYRVKDGVIGLMTNRNAQWDYYSDIGVTSEYNLKDNVNRDYGEPIRKNQVDFRDTDYSESDSTEYYRTMVRIAQDRSDANYEYANEFLTEFNTLDEYLERCKIRVPYAYITPDGEWHAAGIVGWFASSDDTPDSRNRYFKEFMEWIESQDNPYMTLIDCHI